MKIIAEIGASKDTDTAEFELEDMGVSPEEWEAMTEDERFDKVKDYVFTLEEQPYWMLDKFTTQ